MPGEPGQVKLNELELDLLEFVKVMWQKIKCNKKMKEGVVSKLLVKLVLFPDI